MAAVAVRMVEADQTSPPVVEASDALIAMDAYVAGLPPWLQSQLRQALHLFQWGPILFMGRPSPFTKLSPRHQETYVRTWAESRFGLRRRVFRSLRDLAFLGYYSQAGLRQLIGHTEEEA